MAHLNELFGSDQKDQDLFGIVNDISLYFSKENF